MGALDLLLGIQILILALPKLNSGACLPPSCLLGLWGSPSISDEFAAVVHVGRECTIPLQFLCFFGGGEGGEWVLGCILVFSFLSAQIP